jgi:hypothetical protein
MQINTTHKGQLEAANSGAYPLTVVEVDKADRIQCLAEGCGPIVAFVEEENL